MTKMKIYAFWKYDLFPFVLGGEVTQMKEGAVETVEYGKGSWFMYIKVFPLKEGRAIKKQLDALCERYYKDKKALSEKFLAERNTIIDF